MILFLDSETHFKIVLVSKKFEGQNLVQVGNYER